MGAFKKKYFVFDEFRTNQDSLMETIFHCLTEKKNALIHAPTGYGKTIAALAPALEFVEKNGYDVFFLTNRKQQHEQALQTLKAINEKVGLNQIVVNMVTKKDLCAQEVSELNPFQFKEFCKLQVENQRCDFYNNLKEKRNWTYITTKTLSELKENSPLTAAEVKEIASKNGVCPYELSILLAKESKIIVADYNYIFSPDVHDLFSLKANKSLDRCVLIIDEAHNLKDRVKQIYSKNITNIIVTKAIGETKKFRHDSATEYLLKLRESLKEMSEEIKNEALVTKKDLIQKLDLEEYDSIVKYLRGVSDSIIKIQKNSTLENIVDFLEAWQGPDEGFARIITKKDIKKGNVITLNYNCLDPGIYTEDIFKQAKVSILMSGTLAPIGMHRDLLRIKNAKEIELENPFPKENRLNIIIPKTTSQMDKRGPEMYKSIGAYCASFAEAIPGNCIEFFTSYSFLEQVYPHLNKMTTKKILREEKNLTSEERSALLNDFKSYNKEGSILMAVSPGSFGEGIDLPGNLLLGVLVVGIPLPTYDLLLTESIKYYDKRFGKGREYAMRGPAISRVLQNMGRPNRGPTDKGVAGALDERYQYKPYFELFPEDIRKDKNIICTHNHSERIVGFFQNR